MIRFDSQNNTDFFKVGVKLDGCALKPVLRACISKYGSNMQSFRRFDLVVVCHLILHAVAAVQLFVTILSFNLLFLFFSAPNPFFHYD